MINKETVMPGARTVERCVPKHYGFLLFQSDAEALR